MIARPMDTEAQMGAMLHKTFLDAPLIASELFAVKEGNRRAQK